MNRLGITSVLLLLLMPTGCRSPHAPEEPAAPYFRVMTYNVNWGQPAPELAVDIVRREKPDIVCLQETTPQWEKYLRGALARDYPHMSFRSSEGRAGGGLAFLSRGRPSEVAYIPSDTGWFDGWVMQFSTPAGSVQLLNVHLRPPVSDRGSWASGYFSTGDDRMRELQRFYGRTRRDVPLIVAGDFNDGEGSTVVRWLQNKGMRNALPEFDRSTPTWQWQTSVMTLRRRMDHIVYAPELYCFSARAIVGGASDHFPVIATFGRKSEARAPQ